jgi:cobalamin biosynthesis Mg chelatase CobN
MTSRTPEDIQADIEVQREQLAGTVDALTAKLDVKSQAKAKVDDAKVTASAKVADLKDRATTDAGRPRTDLLVMGATVVVLAVAIVWWRRR